MYSNPTFSQVSENFAQVTKAGFFWNLGIFLAANQFFLFVLQFTLMCANSLQLK
jgi:hypothetical protein